MTSAIARRKSAMLGRNDTALRAKLPAVGTKAGNSLDNIPIITPTVEKSKIVPTDSLTHRFKSDSFKFNSNAFDATPLKDLPVLDLLGKNVSRRALFIQNLSETMDVFLSFGNGKSLQGAIQIKAGTSISFEGGICPNNEISIAARNSETATTLNPNVNVSVLEGFVDGF